MVYIAIGHNCYGISTISITKNIRDLQVSTESFHSSQIYLPPPGYHFTSLTLNYNTFGPKKSEFYFFLIFLLSELVYTQKNLNKNAKTFRVIGTVDNKVHLNFNTTYLK